MCSCCNAPLMQGRRMSQGSRQICCSLPGHLPSHHRSRHSAGQSYSPAMIWWALLPLALGKHWPLGCLALSTSWHRRLLESAQVHPPMLTQPRPPIRFAMPLQCTFVVSVLLLSVANHPDQKVQASCDVPTCTAVQQLLQATVLREKLVREVVV